MTESGNLRPSAADEHVFLAGRPPMEEYLTFMKVMTVDAGDDERVLSDQWRAANDRVRVLQEEENGLADEARVEPLPAALGPLYRELIESPIFTGTYTVVPVDVCLVELDKLVVYQKHIDLEYVRLLQKSLAEAPDEEEVFRFCFHLERAQPKVHASRVAANAFVFTSPSNDLRFLDVELLDAEQVEGREEHGRVSGTLALMVGYSSNFLTALEVGTRLVLSNGSHRAYALRDRGVRLAPCVLQKISRPEELDLLGAKRLVRNADQYLKAPRPSVLKDYFDPELRAIARVPRTMRQVKVSFDVEVMDVPVP